MAIKPADKADNDFLPIKLPWYVHPERDEAWRKRQDELLGDPRLASQECDCDFSTSGDIVFYNEWLDFIKETTKQNIINPTKNKLASTLIACFGRKFLVLGIFKLSNDIISFSGPLLLSQLVQFVETKDANLKDGCYYAIALFLTTLIGSIINIHFTNSLNKLCLRIKTALITLIYRKAVVVRLDQLNKYSTGQIVNYMSIDTDSVVNAFPSFHSFWSLPFQICITLYLLYSQIGISFVSIINFFPIYFYNKYCLYLF